MRAEGIFHRLAIHGFRPGPALGRAQDDHRPAWAGAESLGAGVLLNRLDLRQRGFKRRRHLLVQRLGIVPFDEIGLVTVANEQARQFFLADAGEDGGVRNLVTIQVENGEDGAVALRVEEFIGVPACRERPRLRFTIANDAGNDEVGIVKRSAIRVRNSIAQFPALVNRARSLGRDVAGNPTGERELLEQPLHAGSTLRNVGVDLAVGSVQIGVRHQARTAVAGTGDVNHVQIVALDEAV